MKKLAKYRLAFGENIRDLEERVNSLITKGYEPYRDLLLAPTPESLIGEYSLRFYIQVMVKYKKKDHE
jgi:hypothetical protein